MGDHLALLVNRLVTESTLHAAIESRNRAKEVEQGGEEPKFDNGDMDGLGPRKLAECRICQDEDWDSVMETPCSCSGTLKYAHRRCVQRWCNEKGNTICEICHEPFKPGYHAPPPLLGYGRIPVNIRRTWLISRRELTDAHFVETVSTNETLLNSTSFEESSSTSLISRSIVAVIFVGLLILRHTLPIMIGGESDFTIPLFLLAAVRIGGILLFVYVTMVAITGLRRHRYQEENSNPSTSSDDETEQQNQQHQHSHVIQIP